MFGRLEGFLETLTTFDSTKESLQQLLREIHVGHTQLPDFQRGWVWDDEHVRSLIASVSLSFPIGAVMLLETGNSDVRFKPRLVEGVSLPNPPDPDLLILDGQQRLTSLYRALFSGEPVDTKDQRGQPIKRWYYLDIAAALDPNADREDAIIGVPEDRTLRNFRGEPILDYSSQSLECAAGVLPLRLVFDLSGLMTWQMAYVTTGPDPSARIETWTQLTKGVLQAFQQYQIPLISLRRQTPKEAVCQVFEKVNTGGVSLTVFELLTATFAADDYNLRDDWKEREKALHALPVLRGVRSDDVLQVISLLASRERRNTSIAEGITGERIPGITCKRKDILRLTLDDYRRWIAPAVDGFLRAGRLMHTQKIFAARDLPYQSQLTPLAAILAVLGVRSESDGIRSKLMRWYWCGVFGELYGGAIETRFARDLPDVLDWLGHDSPVEPKTVTDATFSPQRLLSLRTRNSAAYKGLSALLLREGGQDFRTGDPVDLQMYFDDRIDIHHIFPKAWCRDRGVPAYRYDCVVNKTAISAKTNRTISSKSPSRYLEDLQRSAGIPETRMDDILRSHVVDPRAMSRDDFDDFFAQRQRALVDRIERATGKPVIGSLSAIPTPLEIQAMDDEEQLDEEAS